MSIESSDLLAPNGVLRHWGQVNANGQEEELRDDFLTQSWANSHLSFTRSVAAAISGFAATARIGFARLHRQQFDAPWRQHNPHCG
ncbi:hypothetical protein [uncultured Sphingomonas sp.]|uniref:hypothetical protein n=1 Tax=uncultured Sphingomonas sp. TaxID=158754 RepID=UPI00262BAA08|nr:hypothetical protein [uncultured Sphingomonas sp.]